jgi:hypothetical protein
MEHTIIRMDPAHCLSQRKMMNYSKDLQTQIVYETTSVLKLENLAVCC